MGTIRQNKIEGVIQQELAGFLQRNAREVCLGALVTVTAVRVTADLSLAKCYVSSFAGPEKGKVLESIKSHAGKIRGEIGKRLKNMRKIPELHFYIDDSLDYAEKIDNLLKKK
ncbi:MAG: ribosome-binding factor [Bacteroidota bacterium]|jgi:ribosome-binding factor A